MQGSLVLVRLPQLKRNRNPQKKEFVMVHMDPAELIDYPSGGLMPEFALDANDLKALVKMIFDYEVQCRCYAASVNHTLALKPILRTKVATEYNAVEPRERKVVELRHRELIQAMASGKDFSAELSKFVAGEGEKPRPTQARGQQRYAP